MKRFADFCYCERIARLLERMTNLKNSDLREEEGLNVYDLRKNRFERRTNINFTRNNCYMFLKYLQKFIYIDIEDILQDYMIIRLKKE